MRKRMRLSVCVVALALLLTAGTVQAAPASQRVAGSGFFGALWAFVAEWLDLGPAVARNGLSLLEKAGCDMDPNGCPAPAPNFDKEGCGMDPNGCPCPASASGELPFEGCDMDSNGRCLLPAAGADMDPDG